jgi:tetratricopeptide (TPR) repeat protein
MSKPTTQDLIRRGTRLLQRGKHIQALEPLEKAYNEDSDDFDAALNLSAAYILNKKFKLAIPILEALRDQEPNNAMLWTNLGAAYLGNPVLAKDIDQLKAIAAFRTALTFDPETPNGAYNIGLIYKDRKEWGIAAQWFEIALQVKPDDADARYWLDEMHGRLTKEQ